MKTRSLGLLMALVFHTILLHGQATKPLKKILELKIAMEGGANGASVAWHPVLKKYYAAMAGNISYSLSVFDATGKRLSPDNQETMFDIRGLWYNPKSKTLQMNGYSEMGWAEYKLNSKGMPTEVKTLYTGLIQPNPQSTASFNPKENVLYFLNEDGNIDKYSLAEGTFLDEITLTLGKTKNDDDDDEDNSDVLEDYNSSTVIYTGITGAEIGLLNYISNEIELYNIKTGALSKKFTFPANTPMPSFLNFSYSNGIYWLFDKELRTWKGYK